MPPRVLKFGDNNSKLGVTQSSGRTDFQPLMDVCNIIVIIKTSLISISCGKYLNSLIICNPIYQIAGSILSKRTPKHSAKSAGKSAKRYLKRKESPKSEGSLKTKVSLKTKGFSKAERSAKAKSSSTSEDPSKVEHPSKADGASKADGSSKAEGSSDAVAKAYFVEVDEEHDGQRIDNFLITHLKGVPRTRIYRIIRKGEVRVNKGRVKQTTRLEEGDMVRIPPIRQSLPDSIALDGSRYEFLNHAILFEDDALLILNKPSGMAVHAGSGIKVGIIEALRALRTDLKYIELVHRLDRETSGCLVLAKKSSALKALHEDFKNNSLKNSRLDKRYLTLVKGQWRHGQRRVTKALNTNAKRHGERFVVVDEKGSYASSIMTPFDCSSLASLIEVKLLTGRTHQVRVHAFSENHPVAGDQKYGDREFNKQIKAHGLSRLFLHASRLKLTHPITEQTMTITAPLPSELVSVLKSMGLKSSKNTT